jgi:hypothetical protein
MTRFGFAAVMLACALPACDGQQYASPDTVRLLVTEHATDTDVIDRCQYIPILLGSEVKSRYTIADDLKVTLEITRDDITLSYEPAGAAEPFSEPAESFEGQNSVTASGPEDYTVELSSPCEPNGPYD